MQQQGFDMSSGMVGRCGSSDDMRLKLIAIWVTTGAPDAATTGSSNVPDAAG